MLWVVLLLFLFPRLISADADWMSAIDFHTWCGLSANLRCRSETCCRRLAEYTGRKQVAKNRHLGTIAQLCWAISSQLRHVSTIGKKLVKQQYVLQMSPQYSELRPTNGSDRFGSLHFLKSWSTCVADADIIFLVLFLLSFFFFFIA